MKFLLSGNALAFISSTSGGSTGAYYYLEGLRAGDGHLRDPSRIVDAAVASSLEATAWGLVFPDFSRAIAPLADPRIDRAWAMERSWLRINQCAIAGDEKQESCELDAPEDCWGKQGKKDGCKTSETSSITSLSDWARDAAEGKLPGVVFNATVVENGQQMLLSNLDLSGLDYDEIRPGAFDKSTWQLGPFDPGLLEHYCTDKPFSSCAAPVIDMPAVTAARLSATFPYVTPVARASDQKLARVHGADGGYFDNSGTVAAVRWMDAVLGRMDAQERAKKRVLFLQLSAFAPKAKETKSKPMPKSESSALSIAAATWVSEKFGRPIKNESPTKSELKCSDERESMSATGGEDEAGWLSILLGPARTILAVRTSTQQARNDLELATLEARYWGERSTGDTQVPRFQAVMYRPLCDKDRIQPALSWELSPRAKKELRRDWVENDKQTETVRRFLGVGE